jgi:hypothetical protein
MTIARPSICSERAGYERDKEPPPREKLPNRKEKASHSEGPGARRAHECTPVHLLVTPRYVTRTMSVRSATVTNA